MTGKGFVYCSKCNERRDSEKVKFLNIEEDFYGRDIMTFKCDKCGTRQESFVYLSKY